MKIDNAQNFDNDKDELIWRKIISINLNTHDNSSTHIVEYYKTNDEKEYYLFNYIIADNNGRNFSNYNKDYYVELAKILEPKDEAYFYEKIINSDKYYKRTTGYFINKGKQ